MRLCHLIIHLTRASSSPPFRFEVDGTLSSSSLGSLNHRIPSTFLWPPLSPLCVYPVCWCWVPFHWKAFGAAEHVCLEIQVQKFLSTPVILWPKKEPKANHTLCKVGPTPEPKTEPAGSCLLSGQSPWPAISRMSPSGLFLSWSPGRQSLRRLWLPAHC